MVMRKRARPPETNLLVSDMWGEYLEINATSGCFHYQALP